MPKIVLFSNCCKTPAQPDDLMAIESGVAIKYVDAGLLVEAINRRRLDWVGVGLKFDEIPISVGIMFSEIESIMEEIGLRDINGYITDRTD
jgi:hypothetical protein